MKRWLLLPLALGVAAFAAYAVLSVPPRGVTAASHKAPRRGDAERSKPVRTERLPDKPNVAPSPVEQPEIREPSRERLLEILREAERQDR